jgi:hypothetical protein
MTQDIIVHFSDISIEEYRKEVKDAIIKHKEELTSLNLRDIKNKDLIINSNNYNGSTSFDIRHNLNFIQQQTTNDSETKIYEGFGAFSTLQGFQQSIPLITFKLGTNRHRERKIQSSNDNPVLVLEITRQYLNTLLQITQDSSKDLGYYFKNLKERTEDEDKDEDYANYIEIPYEDIRLQLFKTLLNPNGFGKIEDISYQKNHSKTPDKVKDFINDNIDPVTNKPENDEFAQAHNINIFRIPPDLRNKHLNNGHIRVKEVNHLKHLYRNYHNLVIKKFFKIDDNDYNMFIVEDEYLDITNDRMAAILITQGLNLDKDLDIQFSDGILESEHLTELYVPQSDQVEDDKNLNRCEELISKLTQNLNKHRHNIQDENNEYSIKLYDVENQILDASLSIQTLEDVSIREFQHGFGPGDIIIIPQKQKLQLSTRINGYFTDEPFNFIKHINLVFEVVDVIDPSIGDSHLYQDDYGKDVINYLKNKQDDPSSLDTTHLDYKDFRVNSISKSTVMGIDYINEPDLDVETNPIVNDNTETFFNSVAGLF